LSSGAEAERALLQAALAPFQLWTESLDEVRRSVKDAIAVAEQRGDRVLLGQILWSAVVAQRLSLDLEWAAETGRRALEVLSQQSIWERADLFMQMSYVAYWRGRFDEFELFSSEMKRVGERAGQHVPLAATRFLCHGHDLMRTGNLRAFVHATAEGAGFTGPRYYDMHAAVARLHLGQIDGLETLQTWESFIPGSAANLDAMAFVWNAMIGRLDQARTLWAKVAPTLPAPERRATFNVYRLEAVLGLALLAEKESLAALYPATRPCIDAGLVTWVEPVLLVSPQLLAGVSAAAAGLPDRAREHFETAIRQADELPWRLMQPTARFWYGCMLVGNSNPAEKTKGRVMVEQALSDFRSLDMVAYADVAEQFLEKR